MKFDKCREKPKGKREVHRRSDGRQELRSCIRSGISQAAIAVHLAVALYGLAFFLLSFSYCFFSPLVLLSHFKSLSRFIPSVVP